MSDELRKLSDAATPGPWSCGDEHGDLGPTATPAWCLSYDRDGKWAGDIAYMVLETKECPPDAAFIVALANAYREGRLVAASPVEGEKP